MNDIVSLIAGAETLPISGVRGVVRLLEEGATVPFISRYRKEATGGMDEEAVNRVRDSHRRFTDLLKRRETILSSIEEQGKLTPELRSRIEGCHDLTVLEDIYLPYKPKKRTRATIAREKGLEPLAAMIMKQDGGIPEQIAGRFVKGDVSSIDEALTGASDIIAEWVNESEKARTAMRNLFAREAVLISNAVRGKEGEGAKYSDYFDRSEPLRRMPSHRLLAVFRGEKEGFLRVGARPDEKRALQVLDRIFIRRDSPARGFIEAAVTDGYLRLLRPSLENEALSDAKRRADAEAIRVFAGNLRQLLLAPPLRNRRVMAIDPGFRSGCKVVCLDGQGNLLDYFTIYPHPPQNQNAQALEAVKTAIAKYGTEAIAVGDGTAGRETEKLLSDTGLADGIDLYTVSEDGASVYSASEEGRKEFPDLDVTVRGAVSIGRRLTDPLAELVKIDPKSIGVGQYQHDVDQSELRRSLDAVVESCVNLVGVDLNTASEKLLSYVSGLGPSLAKNIFEYRRANGPFNSRRALLEVPRLGAKAFEQCAGFLRIPGAANPLDNSAVHPESYHVVERMAQDIGVTVQELMADKSLRDKIEINKYVCGDTGLPTLRDIMSELDKPGRDPRGELEKFSFSDSVRDIADLRSGMELPGVVTNVTNFGAFVDIGLKQDGLVHVSQLSDTYVSDPNAVVRLRQNVTVRVLEVDTARSRISLTMKGLKV
ncbi:MAG: RNA-binding transcriptional accessory protein [Rikenellaceae bacterium]|nr:RNA-binding transcriptional accessory protein [Rikenellaceae bacterium]